MALVDEGSAARWRIPAGGCASQGAHPPLTFFFFEGRVLRWVFLFFLSIGAACADDGRWVFSTGVDYTAGDYGEAEDTTIVTVPFSAGYVGDGWSATVVVPVVSIDGPGTIVPGGLSGGPLGGLLGGAEAAAPVGGVDATGLGDVSLSVSVLPVKTPGGTELSLTGRVRAPTADADRGLGTGEGAAAIGGGVRQSIGARAAVFGSVGYEQAFESGGGGVIAGVGAETYVAERVIAGGTLDFSQTTSDLRRDSTQAGAYVGFDVGSNARLLAYGSAGLTETSPDVGAGLRLVFATQ